MQTSSLARHERPITLGEPLGLRPAPRRAADTLSTMACGETALRLRVFRPGSSLRSGAKTQNLRTLFASGRRCAGARRPPPGHAFRFAPGTSVTSFALTEIPPAFAVMAESSPVTYRAGSASSVTSPSSAIFFAVARSNWNQYSRPCICVSKQNSLSVASNPPA